MSRALVQFQRNLESIKVLGGIYDYLDKQVNLLDLSEILRAQYVLAVSALDYYIHEIVREGMLDVIDGNRNNTRQFNEFQIPFSYVQQILNSTSSVQKRQILDSAIRKVSTRHTYQSPTKIEAALKIIDVSGIWGKVARRTSTSSANLRSRLGLIINRRNKIAHEADVDLLTGNKTPITKQDVENTIIFLTRLVNSIDREL